jgi:heme/copper-type cytochrome/quinol oxidase subunit 2
MLPFSRIHAKIVVMKPKNRPELTPLQHHHRQSFWQIWLPAVLIGLIFLAFCGWVVYLVFGEQSLGKNMASVSVIWWILPSCLGGLIPLAILAASVFGAGKAIQGLPGLGEKAQKAVTQFYEKVKSTSDSLARPVINAYGWQAAAQKAWHSITRKKQPAQDGGLDETKR